MRQSGSEKVETIRLVEDSELSVTATVRELGIPRSTFYGWNRRYKRGGAPLAYWIGIPALASAGTGFRDPCGNRSWKRRSRIRTPHPGSWRGKSPIPNFISESSVYRILKGCDLITSPAYIVMSASDQFQHPTRRVNELWQTDFTCPRSWTITPAISSPGSCSRPWRPLTFRKRSIWP